MRNIELIEENDLARFCSERKQEAEYLLRSTRKTYGFLSDIPSRLLLPLADRIAKG